MRCALRFDPAWEEALVRAARTTLPEESLRESALLAGIRAISRRYTSERERLGHERDGARERAARLLFFAVADALKVHLPLAELAAAGETLRVLDAGAGVGGSAIGVATFFAGSAGILRLDLVEADRQALAVATAALAELAPSLAPRRLVVEGHVGDAIAAAPEGPYDLVIASTIVNELPERMRQPAIDRWLSLLTPAGALVVIEPALRETARALQSLRDRLVERGLVELIAPCVTTDGCPLLASAAGWCHENRPWEPPPRFARLRRLVGLRREGLKFAYLVVRPAAGTTGANISRRRLRVVSDPLVSKGKRELFLCGAGLVRARLLDRDRSDENLAFASAERGDVLAIESSGVERLGPTTRVWRE